MTLRDQYKEKFGKYPSSQMKEETLLKKLGIEELKYVAPVVMEEITETIQEEYKEVIPKEIMKVKTKAVKGYIEPKQGDKVVKMTSRQRAYLLKNK